MQLEKILPKKGPSIEDVKKYIDKYKNEIIVIKCGGSVLLDSNLFDHFIQDISIIKKIGLSIIVIHGGGKNIKKKLDQNGIKTKFINGLRVTDINTIKLVDEALTELNNDITHKLIKNGCNARSITIKNKIIKVNPLSDELGYVGNPKIINCKTIKDILEKKVLPVISPMGIGEDEKIYNINADIAAGSIAKALNSRRLLLMTDVDGVLDKNKKLISELNSKDAIKMIKNGIIQGGMIPKINTCIDAVNNGVTAVGIIDGRRLHSILFELLSEKGAGTLIRQ